MTALPPPPPSPPPSTEPVGRDRAGDTRWSVDWRLLGADLIDLAGIALAVAAVVGGGWVLLDGDGADGFEGLGIALLLLGAGALVALVTWIAVLVLWATGRSLGQRVTRPVIDRPPARPSRRAAHAAARHVTIVTIVWAGVGAMYEAAEPGLVTGPVKVGLLLGLVGGLLPSWWVRRPSPWWRRVGAGALAGVALGALLAVAVPDRPPHRSELRDLARAEVLTELAATPGAVRACDPDRDGAPASTGSCSDGDAVWLLPAGAHGTRGTADRLSGVLTASTGLVDAGVRVRSEALATDGPVLAPSLEMLEADPRRQRAGRPVPRPTRARLLVVEEADGDVVLPVLVLELPCARTGVVVDRWSSERTIGYHPGVRLLLEECPTS